MYHEKFTQEELEKKANDIMLHFNFEDVHNYMESTGWKWYSKDGMRVPSIEEIRITARTMLTNAIWEKSNVSNCGTGGFTAFKMPWGLELHFSIEKAYS